MRRPMNCVHSQQSLRLKSLLQRSIENAEALTTRLPADVLKIDGMSSPKIRILLNEICSEPGTKYLEIGCWKGSTLVAALHGNQRSVARAVACDNFCEFGAPRDQFLENRAKFLADGPPVEFFDVDYLTLARGLTGGAFNVYFYDGGHDVEQQYRAFTAFDHLFDEQFIALVDDYNYPPVPEGTRRAFDKLGYNVAFEAILPARCNGDVQNWWNGLYAAVVERPRPAWNPTGTVISSGGTTSPSIASSSYDDDEAAR